jgi:hypothetical protein
MSRKLVPLPTVAVVAGITLLAEPSAAQRNTDSGAAPDTISVDFRGIGRAALFSGSPS